MNREHALYGGATAAMLIHMVDELFIARTDPVSPVSIGLALLLAASAAVYPRLGVWRAVPALFFGLAGLAAAVPGHLIPALQGRSEPGHLSGLLFVLGALALTGLGARAMARGIAARRAHRATA